MNTIAKMFDSWKEIVTASLTFLVVFTGIKIVGMENPSPMHMQAFMLELSALLAQVGLVEALPKITSIIKGQPKQ